MSIRVSAASVAMLLVASLGGVGARAAAPPALPSASALRSAPPLSSPPALPPQDALRSACAAVAQMSLPDTRITLAQSIDPQPEYVVPETAHLKPGRFGGGPVSVRRAFCRIAGVVKPAIRFEIWLPLTGWNGRFEGLGLGAFSGAVPYAQMATALELGYAVGGTDTGHESGGFDASWAMTPTKHLNRIVVEDWAYRGIHEMTQKGEAIVRAVYAQPPRYRYFVGCSSGGGQALAEAQRFPGDYDGIVAGAPANYWTHLMAGQLYYGLSTRVDPATNLEMPIDKLALIHAAALAACDASDGVRDGIIGDPLTCHFDPGVLACRGAVGDAGGANCLTAAQVEAVRRIYGEARDTAGHDIFPGLAPGSELGWKAMSAGQVGFAQTFYRDLVFQDPSWNYPGTQLGADVSDADREVGSIVNEINANLGPFRAHGGKLLQYAGWADPLISPYNSVNYYRSVMARMAPREPTSRQLADVGRFYRLFMVPGMGHCRGGGTDSFDALGALQTWVEQGRAPAQIPAARLVGGRPVMSRPLCPYPQVARYDGHGNTDEASSFRCALPAAARSR